MELEAFFIRQMNASRLGAMPVPGGLGSSVLNGRDGADGLLAEIIKGDFQTLYYQNKNVYSIYHMY